MLAPLLANPQKFQPSDLWNTGIITPTIIVEVLDNEIKVVVNHSIKRILGIHSNETSEYS